MNRALNKTLSLLLALQALLLSATAFAQEAAAEGGEAAAEAAASDDGFSVLQILADGGWAMYVILVISLIGFAVFFERMFDLYVLQRMPTRSMIEKVRALVERRRFPEALAAVDIRTKHPIAAVYRAGLLRAERRAQEIERAMEDQMLANLPKLTKRVAFLALLANSATLMGLLGTILGLIETFNAVSAASAAEKQEALSSGISMAMYTTAFGVAVALPLLFMHHMVSKRSEKIIIETEGASTALLVALAGEVNPSGPASE